MTDALTRALATHVMGGKGKGTTPHVNADLITYLRAKGNNLKVKSVGEALVLNLVVNGKYEIQTGRMLDGWFFARCGPKLVRVDVRRHVKVTQSVVSSMHLLIERVGWLQAWKSGFEGVPTRGQEGEQVCMLVYLCEKAMGDAIQLIIDMSEMREEASRSGGGVFLPPVVDVIPPSHDEKMASFMSPTSSSSSLP